MPLLRIVLLAAGRSRRLGSPKALARIHGITLLRRTAMLATAHSRRPIIVVAPPRAGRHRVELRGLRIDCLANHRRSSGLSTSVRMGLARGRFASGILFLPVDLAGLRGGDLRRLIARWRAARRRVVARRVSERHGGAPLILPKWLFDEAARQSGDVGLKQLLARLGEAQRLLLDLPSAAEDVDTSEDLLRARRNWRGCGDGVGRGIRGGLDQAAACCTSR